MSILDPFEPSALMDASPLENSSSQGPRAEQVNFSQEDVRNIEIIGKWSFLRCFIVFLFLESMNVFCLQPVFAKFSDLKPVANLQLLLTLVAFLTSVCDKKHGYLKLF